MFDLSGVRVMIAGGSSGIGLSTAKFLTDYGASVIITGRDVKKLESAHQQLGPSASSVAFDAADSEARAKALASIGKLDHLVISLSGGKGAGTFQALSEADLRTGFDAKFWTHFSLAHEAIPYLSPAGSITFVSAISARAANPGTAGLAAINAAIEGLVKPLAVELKPLRVNAVAPGVVDTPWWNWLSEDQKKATFESFAAATPAGRVGKPEDIASAIVFLIGNSFMTGCVIECDGGLRLVGQKL
jgi:NAD(P)-dependent dehydrogenase (short-subunit alcohol dehydrogenase family)